MKYSYSFLSFWIRIVVAVIAIVLGLTVMPWQAGFAIGGIVIMNAFTCGCNYNLNASLTRRGACATDACETGIDYWNKYGRKKALEAKEIANK